MRTVHHARPPLRIGLKNISMPTAIAIGGPSNGPRAPSSGPQAPSSAPEAPSSGPGVPSNGSQAPHKGRRSPAAAAAAAGLRIYRSEEDSLKDFEIR